MKPLQILLLVFAGALTGVVVTRIWQRPAAPQVAAQVRDTSTGPQPSPAAPSPVPQAATPPVAEGEKPSPVPSNRDMTSVDKPREAPPLVRRRETLKPQHSAKAIPPPANPRPVITTARVEQQASAPVAVPAPVREIPVDSAPTAPAVPEPEIPAPPPPAPASPAPNQVTLAPGLLFSVRLVDGLSSERNVAGDTFAATLDRELVADGFVIAERGARVEGRVSSVDRAGKVKGVSAMSIELTRLRTSDGQTISLKTDAFARRGEESHQADAAKVGGAAAVGAIIGAIAGGGKGAAIGAGVGGGAGAGDVLMTRGKPVTFPSETRISFRLRTPVTITERR